jgi:hypothetical protein
MRQQIEYGCIIVSIIMLYHEIIPIMHPMFKTVIGDWHGLYAVQLWGTWPIYVWAILSGLWVINCMAKLQET